MKKKFQVLKEDLKEKKLIKNDEINIIKKFGYFDDTYRSCHPKLFIEYTREYYNAKICRLTIDSNITYTKVNELNFIKSDPSVAVEIKANIHSNNNKLLNEFPFQRVRFSKYCRGFDLLFN